MRHRYPLPRSIFYHARRAVYRVRDINKVDVLMGEGNQMSKIHYATGGLITPERSEFSTLCNRKFPKGGSDKMQSGYVGAQNVTCKDCRRILERGRRESERAEKIRSLVARGMFEKLIIVE